MYLDIREQRPQLPCEYLCGYGRNSAHSSSVLLGERSNDTNRTQAVLDRDPCVGNEPSSPARVETRYDGNGTIHDSNPTDSPARADLLDILPSSPLRKPPRYIQHTRVPAAHLLLGESPT